MRRLGLLVARRPRAVVAAWVVVAVMCGGLAAAFSENLTNRGFYVAGSSSDMARKVERTHFPDARGSTLFVAISADGSDPGRLRAAAGTAATRLRGAADVSYVAPTRVGGAGRLAVVPFTVGLPLDKAQLEVGRLRSLVTRGAAPETKVELIGQAAVYERYSEIAEEDLTRSESLSLPLPLLILVVAFLSVVAACLPILTAILALLVVVGLIACVALVADLSIFALNVASVLTLGLSIDFALFSVTRFRELRGSPNQLEIPAAAVRTVETTGRAIMLSGATVAATLLLLLLLEVGVFASIAVSAAIAALVAAAVGITLIPALLVLLAPRQLERWTVRPLARRASAAQIWRRISTWSVRRPAIAVIASVAVLLTLAVPLSALSLTTRPTADLPSDDTVRSAIEAIDSRFGRATSAPVTVLAPAQRSQVVADRLEQDAGIAATIDQTQGEGGWVRLRAALADDPTSVAAYDAVRRLRLSLGDGVFVGGQSAESVDLVERTEGRAPFVIAAALLLGGLILAIGLRSVLVPIKAVCTASLSAAAGLGVTSFIFTEIGDQPGISYLVPMVLFAVTFGLAVDYESFVMSRIREEFDAGRSNADAIVEGMARTARPVTLAGLAIIPVFLAFALGHLAPFQQMGVGLAVAVLLDITIVRLVLVPGALSLFGDRNWWFPGRPRVAARRPD